MNLGKLFVVLLVLLIVLTSSVDAAAKKKKKYTISGKAAFFDRFSTLNWALWDQKQSNDHWASGHDNEPYQMVIDHCKPNTKIGKHRGLQMIMNNSPCKHNKAACGGSVFASCHMRTNAYFGYGHYEVVMRASHPYKVQAQACFSTYVNEKPNPHNEIDICFAHQEKMSAAFFNGNRRKGADRDTKYGHAKKLKRRADTVMAKYSFTWVPGKITWRVNGKQISVLTSHVSRIPWLPQQIVLILRPRGHRYIHTSHQEILYVRHYPMNKPTRAVHDIDEDLPVPTGSQLCSAINVIRVSNSLSPFVVDQGLNHIASDHASHMARRQTITHHPELSRRPSVYKYYEAKRLAESIGSADGAVTVSSIVKNWMSLGDNKHILGDYEHIGCAVSESSDGRIWFAVEYGSHNTTSTNQKFHFDPEGGFWGAQAANSDEDHYDFGYNPKNTTSSYDRCSTVGCDTNAAGTLVCKKHLKCAKIGSVAHDTCPGECGYIFDGQTSVNCGTCASDSVCSNHKCIKSTCGPCPDNSICENGVCTCPEGSVLKNANCVRVPFLSTHDPKMLESYTFYGGKWAINHEKVDNFLDDGDWIHHDPSDIETHLNVTENENDEDFIDLSGVTPIDHNTSGNHTDMMIEEDGDVSDYDVHAIIDDGKNGIHQTQATANGLAIWYGSQRASNNQKTMVLSVDVELDAGSKAAGLVFNFKDSKNYMFMKYSVDQILFGCVVDGHIEQKNVGEFSLQMQSWAEFTVVMKGESFEFYVNGKHINSITRRSSLTSGAVGVLTEGSAAFANLNFRSRTSMTLKVPSCTPSKLSEFVDNLAWSLRVDPYQLSATCSSNRSIDILIEGTMDYPAESISKDLLNLVDSGAESLADMQLTIISAVLTQM